MESFLLAVAARADAGRTPAAATPAAAITQPERPKWWNAYFGLQFLSRGGRRSLPPLSGAYRLEFLDRKEFWEGEMDELFVCHVAETSSPTDEKEADQGRAPRHLCLTITSFESGVDALHGLPQFFWHWVDAGFRSDRSTTWPFDESALAAAWRWGPGWKDGSVGPTISRVFDATALDVRGAAPLVYADAARDAARDEQRWTRSGRLAAPATRAASELARS